MDNLIARFLTHDLGHGDRPRSRLWLRQLPLRDVGAVDGVAERSQRLGRRSSVGTQSSPPHHAGSNSSALRSTPTPVNWRRSSSGLASSSGSSRTTAPLRKTRSFERWRRCRSATPSSSSASQRIPTCRTGRRLRDHRQPALYRRQEDARGVRRRLHR